MLATTLTVSTTTILIGASCALAGVMARLRVFFNIHRNVK